MPHNVISCTVCNLFNVITTVASYFWLFGAGNYAITDLHWQQGCCNVGECKEKLAEVRAHVNGMNKWQGGEETVKGVVSAADGWHITWRHNCMASVHKSGSLRHVGPCGLSADELCVTKEQNLLPVKMCQIQLLHHHQSKLQLPMWWSNCLELHQKKQRSLLCPVKRMQRMQRMQNKKNFCWDGQNPVHCPFCWGQSRQGPLPKQSWQWDDCSCQWWETAAPDWHELPRGKWCPLLI